MKSIDKINNMLELPKEISQEFPKIIIIGFDEIFVENYQGVLEYEDFYIKLNDEKDEMEKLHFLAQDPDHGSGHRGILSGICLYIQRQK